MHTSNLNGHLSEEACAREQEEPDILVPDRACTQSNEKRCRIDRQPSQELCALLELRLQQAKETTHTDRFDPSVTTY